MNDAVARLENLCRPKLLVRAARIGLCDYNRGRSLKSIFPGEAPPPPGMAFDALFERENVVNEVRRDGGAGYSAARHVEILAALINEARLADFRTTAKAA